MNKQPNKALGQHFLKSKQAAINLIETLMIDENDILLEIGPGNGFITDIIVDSKKFSEFFIVELDKQLAQIMTKRYIHHRNVSVLNKSILDVNLKSLKVNKIIGAVPYYITSPIIHMIVENHQNVEAFSLIIQKEVADKILDKDSSYWNLFTIMYNIKKIDQLSKNDFYPVPKVNSTSLQFQLDLTKLVGFKNPFNIYKWDKFLHRLFIHPRKMLNKNFDIDLLGKIGIDPMNRPHQLRIDQILNLYNMFD